MINTGINIFKSYRSVGIYLFLLVLTPFFKTGLGAPIRFDDIFLLWMLTKVPLKHMFSTSFISKMMLCLCLSLGVSLVLQIVAGEKIILSQANDIFVAVRLFLVVVVAQFYVKNNRDVKVVFMWLCGGIFISAIIGAIQYFRIAPLDLITIKLYTQGSDKYLDGLYGITSVWRVVSTYGNPNYTGLFFVVGAIFSMHSIVIKKYIVIHSAIYFIYMSLCIVAVSSRTSLVLLFVCSFFYIMCWMSISGKDPKEYYSFFAILIVFLVLGFVVIKLIPSEFIPTRIKNMMDSSGSVQGLYEAIETSRSDNWGAIVREIALSRHFVFGNGPGVERAVDSEFLYLLYTQGIVGLTVALIIWAWPFATFSRLSENTRPIAIYLLMVIVALFVFNAVAPVLYHPKAGPFAAVCLGLWQVLLRDKPKSCNVMNQGGY